jgi:hypothetical protein
MSNSVIQGLNVNMEELRASIREEYSAVANEPERGFHFHTGRKLAAILGYHNEWLEAIPASAIESMAGTGGVVK